MNENGTINNKDLIGAFAKTIKHFYPKLMTKWIGGIKDPRNINMIEHKLEVLILQGIFLFLFKLGSRRNLNYKLRTEEFRENLNEWLKASGRGDVKIERFPDEDTINNLLKELEPWYLEDLRGDMVERLIRMRALEKFRLFGKYYLVAIDGTWEHVYKEKHCDKCLKRKTGTDKDGNPIYIYYHAVLEAKLVCGNGMVFSFATEFIENTGGEYIGNADKQKQDCELKAFYRLTKKIKETFPQLPICLLLDGLYAAEPVFKICDKNNWKYITTFKEGSMPAVYEEFERLKKISSENAASFIKDNIAQDFRWVTEIDYEERKLNVLECYETTEKKKTCFVWLTNFTPSHGNVDELSNKGGRCRWKIENEGFNAQKNGGYGLEHAYSLDNNANKNLYFLLQIADNISQLMEKGSLLKDKLLKVFGSIKNFTAALYQAFVTCVVDFSSDFLNSRIQIRFAYDSC